MQQLLRALTRRRTNSCFARPRIKSTGKVTLPKVRCDTDIGVHHPICLWNTARTPAALLHALCMILMSHEENTIRHDTNGIANLRPQRPHVTRVLRSNRVRKACSMADRCGADQRTVGGSAATAITSTAPAASASAASPDAATPPVTSGAASPGPPTAVVVAEIGRRSAV